MCYWKCGKGSPCFKVAENLAELHSKVLWKVKLASNEIAYLAEKISKQSDKGPIWFLLTAYSKNVKAEMNQRSKC